jgi:hypothetical protein
MTEQPPSGKGVITDHAWRPRPTSTSSLAADPVPDRPCDYMNCRRPRSEHERTATTRAVPGTRWERWQKCPVCFAPLGKPCMAMSGGGPVESTRVHSRRQLRAGYARTGGDRAQP